MGGIPSESSSATATSGAKAATNVSVGGFTFGNVTAAGSNTTLYLALAAVAAAIGWLLLRKKA